MYICMSALKVLVMYVTLNVALVVKLCGNKLSTATAS